jgi:hypothetical protein
MHDGTRKEVGDPDQGPGGRGRVLCKHLLISPCGTTIVSLLLNQPVSHQVTVQLVIWNVQVHCLKKY